VRGAFSFRASRVVLLNIQKYPFILSLQALPCPLPGGVARVSSACMVCHWWVFLTA